MPPTDKRPPLREGLLILIMGALSATTPFTIDLYLPAFPEMAAEFGSTTARIALSVSTYFLGYALGQIFYGPLLDRFGRKRPLYAGLTLYLLATLACAQAPTVEWLYVVRFIQALGGCVASVAATAMVRDFFPPDRGARVFSLMMLVLGTSPLFAPTIGGWITAVGGWKSVFYTLFAGVSILLLTVRFILPEGHEPDPSVTLAPRAIRRDFGIILRHPRFYTFTIAGSLSFAGLFVYVAGSPSIFMDGFGVTPQAYGIIFGVLGSGMILGSQLNLWLGRRYSPLQVFRGVLTTQVAIGGAFVIGVWNGWYGLYATIAFLYFLLMGSGISYPNAAASALAPFQANAGRAASLLGFIQLGIGATLSSVANLINLKGTLPTAMTIAISVSLALFLLLWRGDRAVASFTPATASATPATPGTSARP